LRRDRSGFLIACSILLVLIAALFIQSSTVITDVNISSSQYFVGDVNRTDAVLYPRKSYCVLIWGVSSGTIRAQSGSNGSLLMTSTNASTVLLHFANMSNKSIWVSGGDWVLDHSITVGSGTRVEGSGFVTYFSLDGSTPIFTDNGPQVVVRDCSMDFGFVNFTEHGSSAFRVTVPDESLVIEELIPRIVIGRINTEIGLRTILQRNSSTNIQQRHIVLPHNTENGLTNRPIIRKPDPVSRKVQHISLRIWLLVLVWRILVRLHLWGVL